MSAVKTLRLSRAVYLFVYLSVEFPRCKANLYEERHVDDCKKSENDEKTSKKLLRTFDGHVFPFDISWIDRSIETEISYLFTLSCFFVLFILNLKSILDFL